MIPAPFQKCLRRIAARVGDTDFLESRVDLDAALLSLLRTIGRRLDETGATLKLTVQEAFFDENVKLAHNVLMHARAAGAQSRAPRLRKRKSASASS